jgi:hypothetical protein
MQAALQQVDLVASQKKTPLDSDSENEKYESDTEVV